MAALLSEPGGVAAVVIHELGATDAAVADAMGVAVDTIALAASATPEEAGSVAFGSDARRLLARALDVALHCGHNHIGTEPPAVVCGVRGSDDRATRRTWSGCRPADQRGRGETCHERPRGEGNKPSDLIPHSKAQAPPPSLREHGAYLPRPAPAGTSASTNIWRAAVPEAEPGRVRVRDVGFPLILRLVPRLLGDDEYRPSRPVTRETPRGTAWLGGRILVGARRANSRAMTLSRHPHVGHSPDPDTHLTQPLT